MKNLLILLMLSNIMIYSQNVQISEPYIVFSPGDIAYNQHNYKTAIKEFNKTIKEGNGNARIEYNLAVVYAIAGNVDSAFYFLNHAINFYKDSLNVMLGDPDLFLLTKDKRWNSFEQVAANKYFKKYNILNKDLCLQLLHMLAKDQAYYYKIESIKNEKENHADTEIKRLWVIKDSLNKNNVKELEKIIKQYGYPTIKMVGAKAVSASFLVIQHADIKIQKKYLPVIEKLAFNNEINKSNYALLKDRVLVTDGKKQIYGTQLRTEENGTSVFFPIEDSTNVDKRRKEMGLESLNDYYKRFNRDSSNKIK